MELNGYWPAPATLAQHITVIGSVSAWTCRQHCQTRSPRRGVEPVLVLCWASVSYGGPELDQYRVNVSCSLGVPTGHIPASTKYLYDICTILVSNVKDVGPMLYKCYTNVCLDCVLHIAGCEPSKHETWSQCLVNVGPTS